MSKPEIQQYKRGLSLISPSGLTEEYKRLYAQCRMDGDQLPKASSIQRLVAAWYTMWKWRRGA